MQPLKAKPTADEKKQHKELLIDLWMLGDTYGVAKMQNEAMHALTELFASGLVLTVEDVNYIYNRAHGVDSALRQLAVLRSVAQLESPANKKHSIIDYEKLAAQPGFLAKMYEAVKMWMAFDTGPKKNKWTLFAAQAQVQRMLRVPEPTMPVQEAAAVKTFTPGEVIELD